MCKDKDEGECALVKNEERWVTTVVGTGMVKAIEELCCIQKLEAYMESKGVLFFVSWLPSFPPSFLSFLYFFVFVFRYIFPLTLPPSSSSFLHFTVSIIFVLLEYSIDMWETAPTCSG